MERQTRLNSTRLGSRRRDFHRFRIGIFEAAIVSDGPLTLPKPGSIFPDLPPEALADALGAAGLPDDRLRVEQNALLVDLGGHLVLFDTGMGSSTRFGTEAGRLATNLAAAGIDPALIDTLVFHARPPGPLLGHDCGRRHAGLLPRSDLHFVGGVALLGQPAR